MEKEKSNARRSTICVMADFGNGPYAWIRSPEVSAPNVGSCIADAICGFPGEYQISKELEKEFTAWVILFENKYDKDDFDWPSWEEQGVSLARRLKNEVGNAFFVEYHYPCEDPTVSHPPLIFVID